MHPIARPKMDSKMTRGALESIQNAVPTAKQEVDELKEALKKEIQEIRAAETAKSTAEDEAGALEMAIQQVLRGAFDKMGPISRATTVDLMLRKALYYGRKDWADALIEYAKGMWNERYVLPDDPDVWLGVGEIRSYDPFSRIRTDTNPTPIPDREAIIASGQGHKDDHGKFPWHMLPMEFLDWIQQIYHHGAMKYAWDNWKNLDSDRMADAAFRHVKHHIEERQKGRVLPKDTDSGFDSLAHAACDCLMALWLAHKEDKANKEMVAGMVLSVPSVTQPLKGVHT